MATCAADLNLDAAQFEMLFRSGIAERAFQQDLSETRRLPVRGVPTLIFYGVEGNTAVLHGRQSYAKLEQTLIQVTGLPRSEKTTSHCWIACLPQTLTRIRPYANKRPNKNCWT